MNLPGNISVISNPVTGNSFILKLTGCAKGNYVIRLYDAKGLLVMVSKFEHNGIDTIRSVSTGKNIPQGLYYLEVTDPEKIRKTISLIFK